MSKDRLLPGFAALLLIGLVAIGCSTEPPTGPVPSASIDPSPSAAPLATDVTPLDPTGGSHQFADFVETFDGPAVEGGWSFFGDKSLPPEVLETEGGNPGGWLHATCSPAECLDTYAPQLRTKLGTESVFTGDYRARQVTMLGVDLAIFGPEILTTLGRPLSLMLSCDPGTPDNPNDDLQVNCVGKRNIPSANGRFKTYWFAIPSQSETMPEDWVVRLGRGTGDDDADWNTLIANVTQVTFYFGDPDMYYMFQQWELGADNAFLIEGGD